MLDMGQEQGLRRPIAVAFSFFMIAFAVGAGALGVAAAMIIASVITIPPWHHIKALLPLELPLALFLMFIAWVWASSNWSPVDRGQAWRMLVGLPAYCMFGYAVWTLRGAARLFALRASAIILLLLMLYYVIESITGISASFFSEGNSRNQMLRDATRGISAMVMAIPALWAYLVMLVPGWRGKAAAVLAGVLAFLISWKYGLEAGMLGVIVAAIAYGIGWIAPRTSILLVGGCTASMVLTAPLLFPLLLGGVDADALPLSWAIRIENWMFAIERITEKPMFGWGLDASRSFQDTYMIRGLELPNISMHPHNAGLQIWLETGLIGVLLMAASILAFAIRVSGANELGRMQGATIAACSTAFLVFFTFTYGVWQEWFWGAAGWIAALCVLIGPEAKKLVRV